MVWTMNKERKILQTFAFVYRVYNVNKNMYVCLQLGGMEMHKNYRILSLYSRLIKGEVIHKSKEAENFGVNKKSIQRDIDDLRHFIEENSVEKDSFETVVYDRHKKGYILSKKMSPSLTNSEILAVCKILLESRAFVKSELMPVIDKLLSCCVPKDNLKLVYELIGNEKFHYQEPHHKTEFIDKLWDIGIAVNEKRIMKIEYMKLKNSDTVERIIHPVGILFSEYYFYLAAFIQDIDKEKEFENKDDIFPTIYRIDRIKSFEVTDEHFYVPYKDRFEEGEFRKRIQFMWGGKLQKIKFEYKGLSVESVLDRLPTAVIEKEENGVYTISAEVFGKGIDMWLRSQGDLVKVINN